MHTIKTLRIDLQTECWRRESVNKNDDTAATGYSHSYQLLREHLIQESQVSTPRHILLAGIGPLAGTPFPGGGCSSLLGWQPGSETIFDSALSGNWGTELKYADLEQLSIIGKAVKPLYLAIHNGTVEFRDAARLSGLSFSERVKWLHQDLGDEDIKILAIGSAGERQLPGAVIQSCTTNSQASPGGGGLMGDMNLMAVTVKGYRGVEIASPEEYLDRCRDMVSAPALSNHLQDEQAALREFYRFFKKGTVSCPGCSRGCYARFDVPGLGKKVLNQNLISERATTVGSEDMILVAKNIFQALEYGLAPEYFSTTQERLTAGDASTTVDEKWLPAGMEKLRPTNDKTVEDNRLEAILGVCADVPDRTMPFTEKVYSAAINEVLGTSIRPESLIKLAEQVDTCSGECQELAHTLLGPKKEVNNVR